jgi:hypothetical protein
VISTQHFQTSKWIAKTLCNLFPVSNAASSKIRTLEVGAINTQLLDHPRLDVRAIDINSQNPRIEECNFFSIEPKSNYDAVVCSMVRARSLIINMPLSCLRVLLGCKFCD